MASYAQIAQGTFNATREDGTTRAWRFTFEKKNGSAQTYSLPILADIELIAGNRGDAADKPFKTHTLEFQMKGVGEPLIGEIEDAGHKDIRVTLEDTDSGITHFQGFVLQEYTDLRLYNDIQFLTVTCYGGIADLDEISAGIGQHTLDEWAGRISTQIDIDRELDLFTDLRHDGMATGDEMPLDLRLFEDDAVGNDSEATLLDAIRSAMRAFGWQLFQRKGRLVMGDLYDRFNSPSALGKWESDGGGGYNDSTENVLVTLDDTNVLEAGHYRKLQDIRRYEARYNMINRSVPVWVDPSTVSQADGTEADQTFDTGMFTAGDIVSIDVTATLDTQGDPTTDLAGSVQWLRIELRDELTGDVWYNSGNTWTQTETHFTDSFSFDGGGGAQQHPLGVDKALPPVPEDIALARLVIVTECYLTMTTGSASEIVGTSYTNIETTATSFAVDAISATNVWKAASGGSVGRVIQRDHFIGDKDQFSKLYAFQWNDGSSWEETTGWVSPTGNGRLGKVAADRVGTIMVGSGVEFSVRVRDTTYLDLLSVVQIDDNDGNPVTCLPLEVRHRVLDGTYLVRLRQVFDGVLATSNEYQTGVGDPAGGTTNLGGSPGGPGGGGLDRETANKFYLQRSLNLADLTDVDTAIASLGLKAGTKTLNLKALDIAGNTFVDQYRNIVGAVGTFFEDSGQIEAADVPSDILSVIIAGGVSDSPTHGWFQARAPDSDTWHPFALSPKGGGVVIGDTSMSGYTGLRVVGTAAITSTLDIDTIGELTADAGVTIDGLLVKDGSIPQAAVTEYEAAINHDALANFVADEHIDWTLSAIKNIHDDNIPPSAVLQYENLIDHDNLANFLANEHLDWTVSIANEVHLDNIPNLPAGLVTSGTFADERISQSSVTQYEAALTITESQITDGSLLARLAANETVTGLWDFEGTILGLNATVAFEARSSLPQYRWRETDGAADEKQYGAYVENGDLIYETQTDISESRDTFMKVTRTGTDVDPVDFPAGVRQTHNHTFERF